MSRFYVCRRCDASPEGRKILNLKNFSKRTGRCPPDVAPDDYGRQRTSWEGHFFCERRNRPDKFATYLTPVPNRSGLPARFSASTLHLSRQSADCLVLHKVIQTKRRHKAVAEMKRNDV